MLPEEYKTTWASLLERRRELVSRRADLEAELDDLNNEITHLDQILSHLTTLTGQHDFLTSIAGLGITEAIRFVLAEKGEERMSAAEVFEVLKERGFNFTKYSHPMASIYKVLSRLKDTDEVEVDTENSRVFYRWKRKGEEIPF